MNELSLFTREQFIAFISSFRAHAAKRDLTSTDMMLFNIMRGLPADRGFTAITNKTKLANGVIPNRAYAEARRQLSYLMKHKAGYLIERFDSRLTAELQSKLAEQAFNVGAK